MSEIFTKHTSVIYEAKGANKTKAFQDQRLVVTIAKADKDGNYGQHLQQTMATSIPVLYADDVDFADALVQAACTEYLQGVQNSVIGARIKSGVKTHTDDDISVSACIQYLLSENASDKWDAQRIAGWFQSVVSESLGIALLEKNSDLDDESLNAKLDMVTNTFANALSSKAKIQRTHAVQFDKVLNTVPVEQRDGVWHKFSKRLDSVLNPEVDALDLGL